MYNEEKDAQEKFRKWKSSRFSQYDKEAHDEFLKDRY
jgi:hypothetical protein